MIGVSGRVVCLPISVTESRVVSIRAFLTHIFLHALPFLDGESVLVVALIVIDLLIYLPFFKVYEKQLLEQEAEMAAEMEASAA